MNPDLFARIRIPIRRDQVMPRYSDDERASAFARRIEARLRRYRTFFKQKPARKS